MSITTLITWRPALLAKLKLQAWLLKGQTLCEANLILIRLVTNKRKNQVENYNSSRIMKKNFRNYNSIEERINWQEIHMFMLFSKQINHLRKSKPPRQGRGHTTRMYVEQESTKNRVSRKRIRANNANIKFDRLY